MRTVEQIEADVTKQQDEVASKLEAKSAAEREYRTAKKKLEQYNQELLQAMKAQYAAKAKGK